MGGLPEVGLNGEKTCGKAGEKASLCHVSAQKGRKKAPCEHAFCPIPSHSHDFDTYSIQSNHNLLKQVGARSKGMGLKLVKFHCISHIAKDIQMFGVPMIVDTGSNESHHKETKVSAKTTARDSKDFEKQTALREHRFGVVSVIGQNFEWWRNLDKILWTYPALHLIVSKGQYFPLIDVMFSK